MTPPTPREPLDALVKAFNEAYFEMAGYTDLEVSTTVVEQRVKNNPLVRP
jgi:hypothetical protein